MLEHQAHRVMALTEWEERWQNNRIGFHQPAVHTMLKTHLEEVVSGRTGVRFFFPLCGKAVDMKWYGPVCVCVCPSEVLLVVLEHEGGSGNSEKNIFLYRCDLFSVSSSVAGQFGAIWDRGSLVAINPKDRERYAGLIVSLMAVDCRYLLDTLLYDPEKYGGPPFLVPDAQVQSLFGSCCDVKHLQSVDALTDRTRAWGLDSLTENVHLITLKDAGAQTQPR
uniref:Thiopurine S-methyltransferase, tandem duplicate 1 n=1 Tax=Nothobranchius furzeri TaxID=105023 RepID=A0A8C6MC07_NOTFU